MVTLPASPSPSSAPWNQASASPSCANSVRQLAVLVVVHVEAVHAHVEDLASHAESAARGDQARDHRQARGERVVRGRLGTRPRSRSSAAPSSPVIAIARFCSSA